MVEVHFPPSPTLTNNQVSTTILFKILQFFILQFFNTSNTTKKLFLKAFTIYKKVLTQDKNLLMRYMKIKYYWLVMFFSSNYYFLIISLY